MKYNETVKKAFPGPRPELALDDTNITFYLCLRRKLDIVCVKIPHHRLHDGNISWCNILVRPYFPLNIRGIHPWGYKVHYLACTAQRRVRLTMGQVFTFARGGVVEYRANQNATLV